MCHPHDPTKIITATETQNLNSIKTWRHILLFEKYLEERDTKKDRDRGRELTKAYQYTSGRKKHKWQKLDFMHFELRDQMTHLAYAWYKREREIPAREKVIYWGFGKYCLLNLFSFLHDPWLFNFGFLKYKFVIWGSIFLFISNIPRPNFIFGALRFYNW